MRAQLSIWLSMPLVWVLDRLPNRVALRSEIEERTEFQMWWAKHSDKPRETALAEWKVVNALAAMEESTKRLAALEESMKNQAAYTKSPEI